MSDFFWFSDAQWARIGPLLPTDTRGMARVDDRRVLSGIVHALRNGGRWADCPREVYGPKKTLYNRFVRWAERGIWERIFSALAGGEDAPDRLFIDSTCIKVHRCAGGGKWGPWPMASAAPRGAATPSSTLSAMRKGRPLVLLLTPGNVHDCKVAQRCIEAMPPAADSSPTRAMTAKPCATGWQNAEPRPSSHRARTARSNTIMTRPSTGSATSSSACFAASRTGAV